MTKEVSITIEGLQLGSEEAPVTMIASGIYHLRNGSHYIQYDETLEGEGLTKNTIKITPTQIDLTKKGMNFSQMVYDLDKITEAVYQTPYGSLSLEIKTNKVLVTEALEQVLINLEYTLSTNDSHLSDNKIKIMIASKE